MVLDLRLPGISGISALRAIKATRAEQPVLVLSAMSDVESKVRCLELGANDYIDEAFALAELLARVRARLRESGPTLAERFLRVGDVTLDLQRQEAELDGRHVALSAREFDLLVYLMRRAGTVCTREQLLAGVWDCTFDPGTNVVDVYVRRLRRKLGSGVIETLRNVGYTYSRGVNDWPEVAWAAFAAVNLGLMPPCPMAGDPVPPHLGQPHGALRVPAVGTAAHVPPAARGRRADRDGRAGHRPAGGDAGERVRGGPTDVGDVHGDGVAREAPARRAGAGAARARART